MSTVLTLRLEDAEYARDVGDIASRISEVASIVRVNVVVKLNGHDMLSRPWQQWYDVKEEYERDVRLSQYPEDF